MTKEEALTLRVGDIVRFLDDEGACFGYPAGSEAVVSREPEWYESVGMVRIWTFFEMACQDLWTEHVDCDLVRRAGTLSQDTHFSDLLTAFTV